MGKLSRLWSADADGERGHDGAAGTEHHDRHKQRVVVRTARRFLSERHVGNGPGRFDVLAIDHRPGMTPEVRLHKDAFSPQM